LAYVSSHFAEEYSFDEQQRVLSHDSSSDTLNLEGRRRPAKI